MGYPKFMDTFLRIGRNLRPVVCVPFKVVIVVIPVIGGVVSFSHRTA